MEFRAKVLDVSSGVTSCVIDAVNEADARRQIALRNLRVISLEPARRLQIDGDRLLVGVEHLEVIRIVVRFAWAQPAA